MKKILVAPLNWGLGHATRCIPIVQYLLEKKCEVVIAAEGRPLELLRKEFPSCRSVVMPGYSISYPENGSMLLKIAAQIPKILNGIRREHEESEKIISQENIDGVISDSRYGLWSKKIPCVFITHQVLIKAPRSTGFASSFGEKILYNLNKSSISRFTECWIPDFPGGLSGDLGNKFLLPRNAKHIGILSRFAFAGRDFKSRPTFEIQPAKLLVILSGPEPQRTIFEKIILKQLTEQSSWSGLEIPTSEQKNILIVQGITEKTERKKISENIEMVSHLTTEELQKEISGAEIIFSRPGYSTIMDLAALNKKAIFVPTPGQTEQEYLARHLSEKKIAYSVSQKKFALNTALRESEKYTGFTGAFPTDGYKTAIDEWLGRSVQ